MAVETRDIEIGELPRKGADLASTATSRPASRSWMASMLGLRWRPWGQTREAAASPSPRGVVPSLPAPAIALPDIMAAVRAEDAPERLTMHDVLIAWRIADRALGELAPGSPEWAAVNATIISLRASYQARFEEYTGDRE